MANNLKLMRIKAGLNQSDLAEKINCPQSTVSKYETKKLNIENMTLKMAATIAAVCNCQIEDLIKEEPKMNKREIVEFIKNKFEEAEREFDAALKNGAVSVHQKINDQTYAECKEVAAKNGYVGGCFDQLWLRAVQNDARKKGLRPNN